MKSTFHLIARRKKVDIGFQIGGFIIMLLLLRVAGPFALYFEALIQLVSCCYWLVSLKNNPQIAAARCVRKVMMACLALLLITLCNPDWFMMLSMALLVAGPALGTCYFVLTIQEIRFYENARKPYYLL